MKRIFLILFCMFLLVGTVSAFEFDNVLDEDTASYTSTTRTICNNGVCNSILYSGTQFVYEDEQWKRIEDVRSLKDKGFKIKFLEVDEDFDVEVVDFNYTSIQVRLNPKGIKVFPENIPLRIWERNEDTTERNFKNTASKIKDEEISFWLLNQEEVITYNYKIGDIIEFGYNSTTITIEEARAIIKGDAEVYASQPTTNYGSETTFRVYAHDTNYLRSYIWFNFSGLNIFSPILDASLYIYQKEVLNYDSGTDIEIYYCNDSFDEDTIIWNNQGTEVTSCDGGAIDDDFDWSSTGFKSLNITSKVETELSDDESFTLKFITNPESGATTRGAKYDSKEGTNKPYLNITHGYPFPFPIVTLNAPTNNTISTTNEIAFNCTASDDVNLTNVSLILDGVVNETNSSGINNTNYIFDKILAIGNYNWTCNATDNRSQTTSPPIRLLAINTFIEEQTFYNPISYETAEETFVINITTNGSYITSAIFFYNDIPQGASTKTGTNTNANFSNTLQIPAATGNKTFLWQLTVGGTSTNSTAINQTVGNTLFGLCNATLTVPYINFTFVDEETSLNMNATIDTSTWSYWLGDGTYTKSLLYSNNTLNDFYGFCLTPGNVTLSNTRSVQYASVGYPQRKYDASSDLINTTTNKTLYLLSSSDGIYSTIQVLDTNSNQLIGVEVTAERQFAGLWTVVGEETTDSAGAVTFWVNPDYDHRFTFVKTGCTGTTVTIRPTQTQYTQQLLCGEASSDYTATIEGIKYSRTPTVGILQAGTHNFTYYLVSSKDNIINASFYLVNATDQTVLDSSVSACTPSGCLLYLIYVVNSGDSIKGRYYVDVGNGSILLEGDAWWRSVDIPTAGKAGIKTFFQDVIYIFQEWGDDSDTADFNRLVVIFFFMCIGIAVLNYHFNMDSMNPGMFLTILTFFVVMGSIIGGFSPTVASHGLFYYNNLSTNEYINNYLLAGIMMIISFASFLNVNRQGQR